jgi:hypothetical protein
MARSHRFGALEKHEPASDEIIAPSHRRFGTVCRRRRNASFEPKTMALRHLRPVGNAADP